MEASESNWQSEIISNYIFPQKQNKDQIFPYNGANIS